MSRAEEDHLCQIIGPVLRCGHTRDQGGRLVWHDTATRVTSHVPRALPMLTITDEYSSASRSTAPAGDTTTFFGNFEALSESWLQLIFKVVIEVSLTGDTQLTRGSTR